MSDLSIKERKRSEKDGHFRTGLFILRLQKRDTLIKKFQSYKLSQEQIPKTLDQIWNIDESLEILIDLQFSAGRSLPKEMVRWTPYRGLSIYQQWKQEKYEHEIFTSHTLDDDKILRLLSTGTSIQQNHKDKQLSLENLMETDKPWESFKDQHIYRLEEEIKSLKRQIKQRNNLLEKLTRRIRYKLGKLTDHELEKLSEICRFKNTKTNLSEMARHLGVSPDTVKDELQRRGIYKKLMDLKKAK
jgi:predicted HTH domain antitoxin